MNTARYIAMCNSGYKIRTVEKLRKSDGIACMWLVLGGEQVRGSDGVLFKGGGKTTWNLMTEVAAEDKPKTS